VVEIQEGSRQISLLDGPSVTMDVFRQVIEEVKEELDEHRGVINDSTNEIQANFAYLCELDKKIEMVFERLDELCVLVKGQKEKKEFKISPLTAREKEVFLGLYSLGEVQPFVTYRQIARRICTTESVVASLVTNLVEKGVPVLRKYDGSIVYLKLDDEFRSLQAKENLVGVNTVLSYWM